ncbi:zeta toxin family protein [Halomonas sp. 18071143]|uniref:zeta toxin family protein n=1 Tax=Halomonas sp. 18071143 TaxID=2855441 RepID=UPI001C4426FB|nr:zeta toxin family protein [Halomonas sp. 18071143]
MPRLRLVAGPNGSGKTTLTQFLLSKKIPLGQYLNPDDIAKHIELNDVIEKTSTAMSEGKAFVKSFAKEFETYFAAISAQAIATGLREDWLESGLSLTYESVMSHSSHIIFVEKALDFGFEPYLYYICTSSPEINQARVAQRVSSGGHDVPAEKIISRYQASLSLLHEMVVKCRRTYFFDNSSEMHLHFAEATPDGFLDIYESEFKKFDSQWFVDSVLRKWDRSKVRSARPS